MTNNFFEEKAVYEAYFELPYKNPLTYAEIVPLHSSKSEFLARAKSFVTAKYPTAELKGDGGKTVVSP